MQRRTPTSILQPLVILGLGCVVLFGCPKKEEAKDTAEAPRVHLEGELHFSGQRLRVEPFVMRTPEMDLFVACRLAKEAREQAGEAPIALCYEPNKRASFSEVLVEEIPGSTAGVQMRILSSRNEGAHFLVEKTGTIYQILDMAYGPRREGQVRGEEVRVLSGSAEGTENLLKLLREHFSGFKVKRTKPIPEAASGPDKQQGAKP